MESIYRENILDHYQNPTHGGKLENPTITERDSNPLCGDDITIEIDLSDDGCIASGAFSGHGCSISQAAADILLEEIDGKTIDEVLVMTKEEMLDLLGIPLGPVRLKCGLLAFKIVKLGLIKYKDQVVEDEDLEAGQA